MNMGQEPENKYEHGGNIWRFESPRSIIDLSTCVADTIPPEITPILTDTWLHTTLPEPYSASFSAAYREKHRLTGDVLLTAGTTEAIYAICRLFYGKKASILIPTYMDYERAAQLCRMDIAFAYSLEEIKESDLIFICTPNNPTGRLVPENAILSLVDKFPNAQIIVDESYIAFVEPSKRFSTVGAGHNIITLRSYSKVFGLPGLRIGYVTGNSSIIDGLKKQISPWSVGSVAQKTAEKLLERDETLVNGIQADERVRFYGKLAALPAKVHPSDVHFCLCELNGISAADFTEYAASKGILIRDCSNIRGLEHGRYVRISMRKDWENLFI